MDNTAQESPEGRVALILRQTQGLPRDQAIARLREEADTLDLAERFTLLHELRIYAGEESHSGDGSTLGETRAIREVLPSLLERHHVESLLDIPCGDLHWMSRVELGEVQYTGADIVPSLVESNRERFADSGRSFLLLDLTRDPLPQVDLVFCRDLFIHLSLDDIHRALRNIARSGSRFLLTTHFVDRQDNAEIPSGDFRPVNLCRPPFDLPPPLEVVPEQSQLDDGAFADRTMALWSVDQLAGSLGQT